MTEHGILFSGAMVRALLRPVDPKWQTRRVVKPHRNLVGLDPANYENPLVYVGGADGWSGLTCKTRGGVFGCPMPRCPHPVGTRLWVRETWATERRYDKRAPSKLPKDARVHHMADGPKPEWAGRTRVSMHMPRRYARIFLDVTGVRVERAQDISDDDVRAEGMDAGAVRALWDASTRKQRADADIAELVRPDLHTPHECWRIGWTLINGRASWDANPWVWVYEFRRAPDAR